MLHVSLMIILQYVGEFIFPLLGTNRLSLLGDKQVVLFREQTACPYWGTNMLSFFRDKQVALIGDKPLDFIGGQTACLYWGINHLALLVDKPLDLIMKKMDVLLWHIPLLYIVLLIHVFFQKVANKHSFDICEFSSISNYECYLIIILQIQKSIWKLSSYRPIHCNITLIFLLHRPINEIL